MEIALAVALVQDWRDRPVEWLRRMEQRLVSARTLRVRVEEEIATGERSRSLRIVFETEAPTRFRAVEESQGIEYRCDGETLWIRGAMGVVERYPTWRIMRNDQVRVLAMLPAHHLVSWVPGTPVNFDPNNLPDDSFVDRRLRSATLVGRETMHGRPVVRIEYEWVSEVESSAYGRNPPVHATVWIDEERLLPMRREVRTAVAGQAVPETSLETFSEILLDEEIPADRFRIPP